MNLRYNEIYKSLPMEWSASKRRQMAKKLLQQEKKEERNAAK